MIPLSVANILHHRLRSALSALGVAIGVCMLVTLSGLARGSISEIAGRWKGVQADLIVYPTRVGENVVTLSGAGLSAGQLKAVERLSLAGRPAVRRVVPVYINSAKIGSQSHNVSGVRPEDLPALLGSGGAARVVAGRLLGSQAGFERWLQERLASAGDEVIDVSPEELARHGALEMVIDARLARVARLKVGDPVHAANHTFTVVGIVPEGALSRAFIPLVTAQFIFDRRLDWCTLAFVQLEHGVDAGAAARALRAGNRLEARGLDEYRGMLESTFSVMFVYVDAVNAVTLVVAFLFILVTLYMVVLQHIREIAILKAMGAARRYILGNIVGESLLLTGAGAGLGLALAPLAGWAIGLIRPLLTVTITWQWCATGAAVAVAGGVLAALYPAWYAMRIDVIEALRAE